MTRCQAALVAALVLLPVRDTLAQPQVSPSLAEVAREAEAARPTVKKATRTYTNGDLSSDPRDQAALVPAEGFVSKSLGKTVSAEQIAERSEQQVKGEALAEQPEQTWRGRAQSLRVQIEQLQKRAITLTRPNPERDANPAAKSRNDAALANIQTGLDVLRKQWATLEESARAVNLPTAWLDPRPQFQ